MLFGKKINRVIDVKKAEERFAKDREQLPLEKKDKPAMILAALIVFVPAFLLVVGFFALVLYLFFFKVPAKELCRSSFPVLPVSQRGLKARAVVQTKQRPRCDVYGPILCGRYICRGGAFSIFLGRQDFGGDRRRSQKSVYFFRRIGYDKRKDMLSGITARNGRRTDRMGG